MLGIVLNSARIISFISQNNPMKVGLVITDNLREWANAKNESNSSKMSTAFAK